MATFSTGTDAGKSVAVKEDLANYISNISRDMTPFKSSIGKGKATTTFHEWNLDSLADAVTTNARAEASTFADSTGPAIERVGNYTQIMTKGIVVSGTLEAADKAGRKSEFKYQSEKRGKELMRDFEKTLITGQVRSSSTTRKFGSYLAYAGASVSALSADTTFTQGSKDGTTIAADSGTKVVLAIDDVNECLRGINGVTSADASTMMLSNGQKSKFSDLINASTGVRRNIDERGKLRQSIDIYESDFGVIKLVPNYLMADDHVMIYDSSLLKTVSFRPVHYRDINEVGDAMRAYMVMEVSLQADNYKANGSIVGLKLA